MDDLVEFLRARLAEDEAVARDGADGDSGEWFVGDKWNVYRVEDETPHDVIEENRLVVYGAAKAQSDHIARHDPARVLREVEAKRRMLALHAPNERDKEQCVVCDYGTDSCGCMGMNGGWPCETIAILALPYASHPDYRPDWAPSA